MTLKTRKNAVLGSGSAHATIILEFFTIASVLTSTLMVCSRNRGDPSSLYKTYSAVQVLQKHSRFGLAWRRPRADRGLSQPTTVFRTTISVSKILSRSVEILAVRGPKTCFLTKNRER